MPTVFKYIKALTPINLFNGALSMEEEDISRIPESIFNGTAVQASITAGYVLEVSENDLPIDVVSPKLTLRGGWDPSNGQLPVGRRIGDTYKILANGTGAHAALKVDQRVIFTSLNEYEITTGEAGEPGAGGVPEAPLTGTKYVRQNGAWVAESAGGGVGGLQPTPWDIATSSALPVGAQPGYMYEVSTKGSRLGVRFNPGDIALVKNDVSTVVNLTDSSYTEVISGYTTLSPTNKTTNSVLSNGNLNVISSGGAGFIAAEHAVTANAYHEVTSISTNVSLMAISYINSDLDCTNINNIGGAYGAIFIRTASSVICQILSGGSDIMQTITNPPASYNVGDTLGATLDVATRVVKFYYNGVEMLTAAPIVLPTQAMPAKPAGYVFGDMQSFNFGATPFQYPVAGFNGIGYNLTNFSGTLRVVSTSWNPSTGWPTSPTPRAGDLYYASSAATIGLYSITSGTGVWYDGTGWRLLDEYIPDLGAMLYLGEFPATGASSNTMPVYVENGVYRLTEACAWKNLVTDELYSHFSKGSTIIGRDGKWKALVIADTTQPEGAVWGDTPIMEFLDGDVVQAPVLDKDHVGIFEFKAGNNVGAAASSPGSYSAVICGIYSRYGAYGSTVAKFPLEATNYSAFYLKNTAAAAEVYYQEAASVTLIATLPVVAPGDVVSIRCIPFSGVVYLFINGDLKATYNSLPYYNYEAFGRVRNILGEDLSINSYFRYEWFSLNTGERPHEYVYKGSQYSAIVYGEHHILYTPTFIDPAPMLIRDLQMPAAPAPSIVNIMDRSNYVGTITGADTAKTVTVVTTPYDKYTTDYTALNYQIAYGESLNTISTGRMTHVPLAPLPPFAKNILTVMTIADSNQQSTPELLLRELFREGNPTIHIGETVPVAGMEEGDLWYLPSTKTYLGRYKNGSWEQRYTWKLPDYYNYIDFSKVPVLSNQDRTITFPSNMPSIEGIVRTRNTDGDINGVPGTHSFYVSVDSIDPLDEYTASPTYQTVHFGIRRDLWYEFALIYIQRYKDGTAEIYINGGLANTVNIPFVAGEEWGFSVDTDNSLCTITLPNNTTYGPVAFFYGDTALGIRTPINASAASVTIKKASELTSITPIGTDVPDFIERIVSFTDPSLQNGLYLVDMTWGSIAVVAAGATGSIYVFKETAPVLQKYPAAVGLEDIIVSYSKTTNEVTVHDYIGNLIYNSPALSLGGPLIRRAYSAILLDATRSRSPAYSFRSVFKNSLEDSGLAYLKDAEFPLNHQTGVAYVAMGEGRLYGDNYFMNGDIILSTPLGVRRIPKTQEHIQRNLYTLNPGQYNQVAEFHTTTYTCYPSSGASVEVLISQGVPSDEGICLYFVHSGSQPGTVRVNFGVGTVCNGNVGPGWVETSEKGATIKVTRMGNTSYYTATILPALAWNVVT